VADWKDGPRCKDREASIRKLLADPLCRACGARAVNSHHLIGKGQGGDDDVDNLIPLCGSGSSGCHGALHGNPYVDASGRRWDAFSVRQAIGLGLRPSEYACARQKLGDGCAATLARLYHVELAALYPFEIRAIRKERGITASCGRVA
jgi:hypothetical protein